MPALAFHKLCPFFTWGITNYPPDSFEQLLGWLVSQGYSLDGSDNNPKNIQITLDDGYAHLSDILPPLIERYRFRPTIFMPTAFIGHDNSWDYSHAMQSVRHLDRGQIEMLARVGVRFGSHGHTHRDLTTLNSFQLIEELTRSRDILEDITGERVIRISYPFGNSSQRVRDLAAEHGYEHGYTMRFPSETDSPLLTGRIPVYSIDNLLSIRFKLSSGPMRRIERRKSAIIHAFSAGTGLLNRIRRIK